MWRLFRKLLLTVILAAVAGASLVLYRSIDPVYTIQEWVNRGEYHRYDKEIREVAKRYEVEAELVKALVWRESGFQAHKTGKDGERGLMQILPTTAGEWAAVEGKQDFHPDQLFDPEINLEAGTWYLKRALDRWSARDDPKTFALAEYNAGPTRAARWLEETGLGKNAKSDDFFAEISYPGTRKYVDSILERYNFYKRRGRL